MKYLDTAGESARQAAGWAGQRANEGWDGLNHLAKEKGGVDLNEQLERLGVSGPRHDDGYGRLERAEDGVLTPHGGMADTGADDFFDDWNDHADAATANPYATGNAATMPAAPRAAAPKVAEKKADGWNDDEWKDF